MCYQDHNSEHSRDFNRYSLFINFLTSNFLDKFLKRAIDFRKFSV